MINRLLDIKKILGKTSSSFLFGPRGAGKTLLCQNFIQDLPLTFTIDLLQQNTYNRYVRQPGRFRQEIERAVKPSQILTVFIDEIQKLPLLLDEVHSLIESHKKKIRFILTGSSARKLKRGGANLLAGRAWVLNLHPLTHREGPFDLDKALQFGTLPGVFLDDEQPARSLKAYVETYLKEEIRQEALVRHVEGFIRFLEIAGQMNAEPLNYSRIARDCGTSAPTIQEYVSILADTMVAFSIPAWTHSIRKQLRQSPKLYFFDCGVLNAIRGELAVELSPKTFRYGRLFETWLVQEIIRLNDYQETDYKFFYWRTNSGLEVDLILQKSFQTAPVAIEIKSNEAPEEKDLRALLAFQSENPEASLVCLCRTPHPYQLKGIDILPWAQGLESIFPRNTGNAGS